MTNAHVVERADRIEVQLFDGEVREGEVVDSIFGDMRW